MTGATWDLAGRSALVTGAARGIGAETARRLAARGAHVSLVGLEPERLEPLAAELGGRTTWFEADVTDAGQLDAAVSGTAERLGGIDVVIANAGIYRMGTVANIAPADFERTVEVNLLGVWRTVRAALPHVIAARGYVLPVASLAAAVHAPLMAAYAASKAGVEAFANSLRVEVAPHGVDVGVAYFGFIDTDMVRSAMSDPALETIRDERGGPTRPVPVGRAGAAIVRAVERRARRAYAPRWILPLLLAGDVPQMLVEMGARRRMGAAVELADAMAPRGGATTGD